MSKSKNRNKNKSKSKSKKSKRKLAQKKQFEEQLHIINDRGATFVGFRPTTFQDKKHPSRAKQKDIIRKGGEY